jgi:8-oxo-dGTP pyrophosphatase MutT (NUDIX family)
MIDEPPGPLGSGTEADPRLVVESWPVIRTRDGWRLLMLRRTPQSGRFWQGVSGRVEGFDASLRAAALREIREETGLDGGIEIEDLGLWLTFRGPISGAWFRKRSLVAILPETVTATMIRLSDEHDAAEIVTLDDARARLRFKQNLAELDALEARLTARG